MVSGQKLHNRKSLLKRRQALRSSLTPAEAVLWRVLQRSQLQGRKFRRQHSIGAYIVDFYCPREKLVIELDGSAHDDEQSAIHDRVREQFLSSAGLTVLRLENRQVFENPDGVVALIQQHFKAD